MHSQFEQLTFGSFQELNSSTFLDRIAAVQHPAITEKPFKQVAAFDSCDQLSLSITTKTAFDRNIAHFFKTLLILKKLITPAQELDLETVLHEGIANAVLHGTLGIENRNSLDATTLEIHNKLQDPAYANKIISLTVGTKESSIYVRISCEKTGAPSNDLEKNSTFFGRGLSIIQEIAPKSTFNPQNNTLTIILEGGSC